ncbi:MAG: DUF2862 domain-containing protein [Oscillatoriales cyanobacterium RM2_1_1]|nr:DUF2862 domain-containing protein [Oscillatoriales cyanobacterium SM2_3_0]NJO46715.1 DUF2862 domain-containing protein [Oscillatoriales cyanobacterium RM2_1_1]
MEIGQKVKVRGVKERVSADIVSRLRQNPFGVVEGYKMVDGSSVGFVVRFDDLSTWFFEDELEAV